MDDIALTTSSTAPTVERRKHYRSRVLPSSLLRVRLWTIAPGVPIAHQPMPSHEIKVSISNMSVTGMGLTFHFKPGRELQIGTTDRLRIEMHYLDYEVLIEGKVREVAAGRPDVLEVTSGIHFEGRHSNIDFQKAQSTLSTIMGYLQREELRLRSNDAA